MNDMDRWPATADVPELTPEIAERLERKLAVALAADRRRWAWRRRAKRALFGAILAACLGRGGAAAFGGAAPAVEVVEWLRSHVTDAATAVTRGR